jgi:hypothetical protein
MASEKAPNVSAPRPYDEYRNSALWSALEHTIRELIATREITVNTAPEYVIGYLCRELMAKRVVTGDATPDS